MNIVNIDKVVISFDIKNYDNIFYNLIEKLFLYRNLSYDYLVLGENRRQEIELDNEIYEVLPNGNRNHAFILEGQNYKIYLSQVRSKNENFYPIKVDVSSKALWQLSPEIACKNIYSILNWINENYNNNPSELDISERVSRIDLCCHTDEFLITDDTIKSFQGRYRKRNTIDKNNIIETVEFGMRKSPIFCRIYDKTAEIKSNPKKAWFIDIWKNAGMDIEKVWNIEFELHRSYLRDVKTSDGKNLETFADIFSNLKLVWSYCTEMWLKHKELKCSRIEECPVSKGWQIVQRAYDSFENKGYITREKQCQAGFENIIPWIVGGVTSIAANYPDMSIDEAYLMLYEHGRDYLKYKKETTYDEVIEKKRMKRLGVALS